MSGREGWRQSLDSLAMRTSDLLPCLSLEDSLKREVETAVDSVCSSLSSRNWKSAKRDQMSDLKNAVYIVVWYTPSTGMAARDHLNLLVFILLRPGSPPRRRDLLFFHPVWRPVRADFGCTMIWI
jgi:hypothetical protein